MCLKELFAHRMLSRGQVLLSPWPAYELCKHLLHFVYSQREAMWPADAPPSPQKVSDNAESGGAGAGGEGAESAVARGQVWAAGWLGWSGAFADALGEVGV